MNENSILKHMSILEIAWIGFLFLLGLFYLFDAVEATGERESILEIAGKERLTLLSVVFGFIIIHLSLFMTIVIRYFRRS